MLKHRKPRDSAASLSLALMVILALQACSYALVGKASNIPEDVRTVYLKPLENQTQRIQIEQFLTQAIANELVTRQRFSLVPSEDGADAVLSGAVTGFRVAPITFDAVGRADAYEISITADVDFLRTGSDEVLWGNDRYLFKENYPVEESERDFIDLQDTALVATSQRFAETMVSDLLEGF